MKNNMGLNEFNKLDVAELASRVSELYCFAE